MEKPSIHFITYGNEKFAQAKKRILKEAEDFGEFKTVKGYGPQDLDKNFINYFKNILNQPRGGGYWIWKTFLLYKTLTEIKDNEYIVYSDAGCKLNKKGLKRFNEYIDLIDKSNYGILSMQMSGNKGYGGLHKDKEWTTKQIFDYFSIDIDSEFANTGQYLSTVLIIKKNEHSRMIFDKYIKALYDNPLMFTDYYNKNQCKEFIDNRHDQSVFSLLRKKYGSVVISGDESWVQPFGGEESLKFPFWATRSKN